MEHLDILLKKGFRLSDEVLELGERAYRDISGLSRKLEKVREYNELKVIKAMQDNKLSDTHFNGTTGYGYDDRGREVLDSVYAQVFGTEDALVRHQLVAGTHSIAISMFAVLRPGDELLSITGKPYDTLEEVIGIRGGGNGSLKEFGVSYRQVDLLPEGNIDYKGVKNALNKKTRMVYLQRSRGYSWRPSINVDEIGRICEFIKSIRKDVVIMVDNCYGEFVEEKEPSEVGADIIAGSLIKNPGGGLAPTGGYIAGRKDLIEKAAYRLTTPGLGKKVGSTLGQNRLFFQGLFLAPHIVAESLKGAVFCARMMQLLGFDTSPAPEEERSDIIQAIRFDCAENLISFCQGIQKGSPVDSHVTPEPWDMPGYDSPVIMAAGAFIQGSSIELSADAPIKEPYTAYLQGGLVFDHVKIGVLMAVQAMLDKGIIKL